MRHLSDQEIEDQLAIKYDYIYSNFEMLFKISLTDNFDINILKMMIQNIYRVKNKELSNKES